MSVSTVGGAYYAAPVDQFLATDPDQVIGGLTRQSGFAVDETQRDAWVAEVAILRTALTGLDGFLLLEFDVPRVGGRIDAVLVTGPAVFVIEFKVGERRVLGQDINQVWDYGLDLKNFHQASHAAAIFPVLVATDAADAAVGWQSPAGDQVYRPVACNSPGLATALQEGLARANGTPLDGLAWARAPYQPTPTIIEAARALYARHSVAAISRNDAGARNLAVTSGRVEHVIEEMRGCGGKAIIFVTGVPGAGKTLVGLDVATRKRHASEAHAVFLSGNGPLVKVLREALTLDEVARLRAEGRRVRKGEVLTKVKAFIQNVHHFRDEGLNHDGPPADRVVIFDEAQRAWNRDMTVDFMRRKKRRQGFTQSEPEFLLSYMDRHSDWAVVVCLVGGGQEINRGEAGIATWLDAIATRFTHWRTYISPNLSDAEYAAGHAIQSLGQNVSVTPDVGLHLSVSMRSFRAEHVSRFVKALLDHDVDEARALSSVFTDRYPIVLTRDLARAKAWVRERARGSERFGLVASSKGRRLKPEAVDVRYEVDPVHWFLGNREDTRSSFYLEDAATEFQVQGLELDWACVAWDADLRFVEQQWNCYSFSSIGWRGIRSEARRTYLRNAYRVLLTRARQGMAIFVPHGDAADPTRVPSHYDGTFDYLASLGLPVI